MAIPQDVLGSGQVRLPDPEVTPAIDLWPDAGQILGLSRQSTYGAAKRGEIPTVRLGRRLVVPTARLRQMLGLSPEKTAHPMASSALSPADLRRAQELAASAPPLSPGAMAELRRLLGGTPAMPGSAQSPAA